MSRYLDIFVFCGTLIAEQMGANSWSKGLSPFADLIGGGKGTTLRVIETLVPKEKRLVVSTSEIIKGELLRQGVANLNDRRVKQEAFLRIAREEGEDWLTNRVAAAFRRNYLTVGIWDKVCMPSDIKWLQTLPKWQWTPLYIDAPFTVRLERARAAAPRGEPDSKPDEANMTEDDFRKTLSHETATHIPGFRDIPGTFVIRHDSDIENLGRQVISVLRESRVLNDSDYLNGSRALLRFYDAFKQKIARRQLEN
jgi:hypothetical protein